jgi:signal transduction histidine kinase
VVFLVATATRCSGRSNSEARIEQALGLGLAFSRWGAEANRGRIHTRNVPGHGCVFIVDLPRFPVPALASSVAW